MAEQSEVSSAHQKRILTNERELLAATRELADGMAARGGPIQALEDACAAMGKAEKELEAADYSPAVDFEQGALAALIRARQNIRQKLSPANSSSATACRQFDHQQRQKLRTADELKKQKQEQLADSRAQLNELAHQQRQWSDDVQSGSRSVEQEPSLPDQKRDASEKAEESSDSSSNLNASSTANKSREELEQQQSNMIEQLRQLERKLASIDTGSEHSPEQAEQIAEEMQSSLDALEQQQADKAAQQAEQSAEKLEQLADHLAAINSTDFSERLGQAQRSAQHLAQKQKAIEQQLSAGSSTAGESSSSESRSPGESKKGEATNQGAGTSRAAATASDLAERQQELSSQAELLAELMSRLRVDSNEQAPTIQSALESIHTANPPAGIVEQMKDAAGRLASGDAEHAAKSAGIAGQRLDELAKELQRIRGEYGQPSLEELMALEAQVSKLIEQLARSGAAGEPTSVQDRFEELEPKLEALATDDRRLAGALQQLRTGSGDEHTPNGNQQVQPGFYTRARWADRTGLTQVNKALQIKIQEAILAGALLDADDAVPPEYKELVEKYYRELSNDLR